MTVMEEIWCREKHHTKSTRHCIYDRDNDAPKQKMQNDGTNDTTIEGAVSFANTIGADNERFPLLQRRRLNNTPSGTFV